MYRLTPRMLQRLKTDLSKYHDLFNSKRCSGWELEELIVAAIKSDTQAQHHVQWQEAGHDDRADIIVHIKTLEYPVQIKSGSIKTNKLTLSGHRLGRFKGDMKEIVDYLNNQAANIMAIPYRQINSNQGRQHIYRVGYVDIRNLTNLDAHAWGLKGKQWIQVNSAGVEFSLRPSMSWQIWWRIPCNLVEMTDEFIIG